MIRKLAVVLLALMPVLVVSPALASQGMYVSGKFGAVFLNDANNEYQNPIWSDFNSEAEFDTGVSAEGAIGYDFGIARLEGEIGYRFNEIDRLNNPGGEFVFLDGDVSTWSFMVNTYMDYENPGVIEPYLGFGIGVANVSVNDLVVADPPPGFGAGLFVDDEESVFAYQVSAGLGIGLSPNVILDMGYRFFATSDPEFVDLDGDSFDSEYESHNVSLGLRFLFY